MDRRKRKYYRMEDGEMRAADQGWSAAISGERCGEVLENLLDTLKLETSSGCPPLVMMVMQLWNEYRQRWNILPTRLMCTACCEFLHSYQDTIRNRNLQEAVVVMFEAWHHAEVLSHGDTDLLISRMHALCCNPTEQE